ncbi:MAG: crossover junction endodeoxyribonuclease RuvC [Acutalibacteraceae bacterium]|nr:crossover junction endodeoxyribonuclease RuvC [Clostridia bacterium]MEE3449190.1 crossover junction endodeoxyribonuclease RuvC [Acutalibacteraceae bacterium]
MVVLGIDPGYAIVGYGGIEYYNNKYHTLGFGAILTTPEQSFDLRLEIIYREMCEILDKCKPDVLAIEKLYFQNNQKTAIDVAQARGVILLSARLKGVPIFEYTPLEVKTAVTGYGRAKKEQVMEMTKRLLKLQKMPKLDDTADALAIAICHTQANGTPLKNFWTGGIA